jgi:arginase
LKSTGVEDLPKALKQAGLYEKLDAEYAGEVEPSSQYNPKRDEKTLLLNAVAIREFSLELSNVVLRVLGKKQFPIVLGGDCSVVIGLC